MALINCPECGKEISDSAKQCPNCGFPLVEKRHRELPLEEKNIVSFPWRKKNNVNPHWKQIMILPYRLHQIRKILHKKVSRIMSKLSFFLL